MIDTLPLKARYYHLVVDDDSYVDVDGGDHVHHDDDFDIITVDELHDSATWSQYISSKLG